MRPKERRDSGQSDCFKIRLHQIVDMGPSAILRFVHAQGRRGFRSVHESRWTANAACRNLDGSSTYSTIRKSPFQFCSM